MLTYFRCVDGHNTVHEGPMALDQRHARALRQGPGEGALPELKWRFGYAWALGLMLTVPVALVAWFKRRGWL